MPGKGGRGRGERSAYGEQGGKSFAFHVEGDDSMKVPCASQTLIDHSGCAAKEDRGGEDVEDGGQQEQGGPASLVTMQVTQRIKMIKLITLKIQS